MQDAFFEGLREENFVPARVSFAGRDHYRIRIPFVAGDFLARPRGKFHAAGSATGGEGMPVVGDWVVVNFRSGDHEFLPIESLLPRRSTLRRAEEGASQVMVANIDHVGLVTSFNRDLNPRRLERGIAMALEGGTRPFVVLNKSDLLSAGDRAKIVAELAERFAGVPIAECSAVGGRAGVRAVAALARDGETVTLLGMSGVGKSTLVNALLGEEVLATGDVRAEDARGRHTTTHRELFLAPEGFWLIDAPGIRAFAPAGDGVEEAFADLAVLARGCRFGDCRHAGEPGCAVQTALAGGELDPDRWENYLKLEREREFHERKHDKAWVASKEREWAKVTASLREKYKARGRK